MISLQLARAVALRALTVGLWNAHRQQYLRAASLNCGGCSRHLTFPLLPLPACQQIFQESISNGVVSIQKEKTGRAVGSFRTKAFVFHASLARDEWLKQLSWTHRQTADNLFARVLRGPVWSTVSIDFPETYVMWRFDFLSLVLAKLSKDECAMHP